MRNMEDEIHQESPYRSQPALESSYPLRASFLFTGLTYRYRHARTSWSSDHEAALMHQSQRGGTVAIVSDWTTSETRQNLTPHPQSLNMEVLDAPCNWFTYSSLDPQVVHFVSMQSIPEAQIDLEQLNWGDASDLDVEDEMTSDEFMWPWPAGENEIYRDGDMNAEDIHDEELLELEQQMENVNIGLSRDVILENIVRRRFSLPREGKECCICLDEYTKDGERLGILDCTHEFHLRCIVEWLRMKNTCPVCREIGLAVPDTNRQL